MIGYILLAGLAGGLLRLAIDLLNPPRKHKPQPRHQHKRRRT